MTDNFLKRVQICKQIFNLLLGHDLVKTFHLGASILNDVGYALIIRRKSAERQVGPFLPCDE